MVDDEDVDDAHRLRSRCDDLLGEPQGCAVSCSVQP
jgi:hypothetical protein